MRDGVLLGSFLWATFLNYRFFWDNWKDLCVPSDVTWAASNLSLEDKRSLCKEVSSAKWQRPEITACIQQSQELWQLVWIMHHYKKMKKYSSHFSMILIIGYKIRLLCLLPKARLRCFMLPFAWTDCGTMLLSLEILSLSDCGTFINRKGQLLTYMTRLALLISYVLAEVLELEEEPHPKSTADH